MKEVNTRFFDRSEEIDVDAEEVNAETTETSEKTEQK